MKKLLLALALVAACVLAVAWTRTPSARRFTEPAECVEAYYRALKDADEAGFLACLADELHGSYPARGALAADLRARGRDLRGWVLLRSEPAQEQQLTVWVDEQFSDRRRRQKLILEKLGPSWRVASFAGAEDVAQKIPFGTHVSQVAADPDDD